MTRDITPIKWIIGAIALLIIIAGACVLWYRYDTAPYRQEAANAKQLLRQSEIEKSEKSKVAEQAADAPAESTTQPAEKSINETTAEVKNNTEAAEQQTDSPSENVEEKDVPVSPFGFGPYPQVPEGMLDPVGNRYKPAWERSYWQDRPREGAELLSRVLIKAWQDGKRGWIGASGGNNGKVWINYPNTMYVWYGDPIEQEDGTFRPFFRRVKGGPPMSPAEMRSGIAPAGYKVLDGEKEAIDIFEYLDLQPK